jgi:hypothetical protein
MNETKGSLISSSVTERGDVFLRHPTLLKSSPTKQRKILENKFGAWG